jgi:putative transposase
MVVFINYLCDLVYLFMPRSRKTLRLPNYDYSSCGEYFITICVNNRECVLSNIDNDGKLIHSKKGLIVDRWIQKIPKRYSTVEIEHYTIMPDHIHLIIEIVGIIHESSHNESSQNKPLNNELIDRELIEKNEQWIIKRRKMLLSKVIGYLKMNSSKEINLLFNTSNSPFWQSNYYERIIRDQKEYNNVAAYIRNNPLNWKADEENPRRDDSRIIPDDIDNK